MAEELSVELARRGYGCTSNPDNMTTQLEVKISATRNLGDARKLVHGILKKHLMENDVEIEQ